MSYNVIYFFYSYFKHKKKEKEKKKKIIILQRLFLMYVSEDVCLYIYVAGPCGI